MFNDATTLEQLATAYYNKREKLSKKKLSMRDLSTARQNLLQEFNSRRQLIINSQTDR